MSDAASIGVDRTAAEQVELLAALARDAGADGVVCSPHEAAAMRESWGREALIVTPGVRPEGADSRDQSRVMTPAGGDSRKGRRTSSSARPITGAPDPAEAFEAIVATWKERR